MAEKKLDVVVVGELNIDLVLWKVPMPEYEQEKLAGDMRFHGQFFRHHRP